MGGPELTGRSKFIVEGLRSGVPYRDLAKTVAFGREKYIDIVKRMMEGVEQGRAPKLPSLVLRANYGEGKTHLLHSLWGAGEDRNWVVSFVSLSKETPLDRLDYLYPKLMENTYIPGSAQPGIAYIVAKALENQLLPEARTMGMSARIMAVLDGLVVHDEGYDELLADVAGNFLGVADLKRIYRQNLGRAPQLTKSSMKDEAFEYMRLIDWLIQKAGFAGWLILIDEVELIGKFGKGARSQAYANMGRMIEGKLPHALSVWALAANFFSDVLIRRNDREECPRWLSARQKEEERAPWSEAALDALLEAKLLDPLTSAQIKALVQQIHELHQEAYAWSAPFSSEDLYEQVRRFAPTQDTRLRTYVRLSLAILDIWYQHGEPPVIEYLDPLQDAALDEQPERDTAGGVGGDGGGGNLRHGDGQRDGGDGEADEANSEPGEPNMITRRLIFHD